MFPLISTMEVDFWKVADISSLQFLVVGYSVLHFCIPLASDIVLCNVGEIQDTDMKNMLKKNYKHLEFCIHIVHFCLRY